MTQEIVQGNTLVSSNGNKFKVKSVDVVNVNLTNGQHIPVQFVKQIFTVK